MVALIILFLIITIVAAIFGFGGTIAAITEIAIAFFWLFLLLFVVSLLYHTTAKH